MIKHRGRRAVLRNTTTVHLDEYGVKVTGDVADVDSFLDLVRLAQSIGDALTRLVVRAEPNDDE